MEFKLEVGGRCLLVAKAGIPGHQGLYLALDHPDIKIDVSPEIMNIIPSLYDFRSPIFPRTLLFPPSFKLAASLAFRGFSLSLLI